MIGEGSTSAGPGERLANRLRGYWFYLRKEGRVAINVFVFLALSAFLIITLIFTIFRVQPRYDRRRDVRGVRASVFTGQEVTYRGVTVGRVGPLRVVRDGVRIELVIERTYDEIPKDGHERTRDVQERRR